MNRLIYLIVLFSLAICSCNMDNTQLFNQACELEAQGKYEEAINLLTKAIKINHKDIECYNNRAWDYIDIGKDEKALDDFRKMLEIDPVNTAALYGIGYIYYKYGLYNKSIEHFDKIIELIGGGPLFLELTDNKFIGQRVLEADIENVYRFKNLAEEKLDSLNKENQEIKVVTKKE